MKPDDRNGKLPLAKRPFRVLLIAGSDRRQYNCPGVAREPEWRPPRTVTPSS